MMQNDVLLIHLTCPRQFFIQDHLEWSIDGQNGSDWSQKLHQSTARHETSTFQPDYPPVSTSIHQYPPVSTSIHQIQAKQSKIILKEACQLIPSQGYSAQDILWHPLTFKLTPRLLNPTQNLQTLIPRPSTWSQDRSIDIHNNPKPFHSYPESPRPLQIIQR